MAENVGSISYSIEADTSPLVNSEKQTSQWFKNFEQGASKADGATGKLNTKMKETAKAAKEASNGIQNVSKGFGVLYAAAAAFMALGVLQAMAELADQYGQNADRIKNATSSMEEYNMVQERMLAIANSTYRSLAEAQEVYLATADGLRDLGYTTSQVLDITDSMSYAFVRDAARKDQATTAMDAYSKALMKGKIEADAWASIMAAMPSIAEGISEATGRTTQEIKKLGAEGKLSLEALNEGFLAAKDTNEEMAANMRVSTADAMQAMRNSLQVFIGKIDEASGSSQLFADSVAKFTAILQDPQTISAAASFAEDIVQALNWIIETARDLYLEVKTTVRNIRALFGDIDDTDFDNLQKRLNNLEGMKNANWFNKLFDGFSEEELDAEINRIKKQIDDGARQILEEQAKAADKLFTQEERIAEKRKALVNAEAPGKAKKAGKSEQEKEADRLAKQAAAYLEKLQEQTMEVKSMTAQQKLQYDLAAGNVRLKGEELALAQRLAREIDLGQNMEAFQKMSQALAEAALSGEELAKAKARATLNAFATPEEIDLMEQMAVQAERISAAKTIDQSANLQEKYEQELVALQTANEMKLIEDQRYLELKAALEYDYEEQKRALAEETFRKQSEWNDMLMSSIDALGGAATSSIMGLLDQSMTLSDVMRNLGRTILNSVVQSFVQMGVEYVKNAILAKTMGAATTAATVAMAATSAAAWAPAAALASLASFGANAAPASAGIASTVALSKTMSVLGGRQYGGPVAANGLYRINENGAPEVFNAANGQQYMLPNTRGEVVSNKEATQNNGYVSPKITVQLIEDSSRAGNVNQQQRDDEYIIQAFVANIRSGGDAAQVLETTYPLQRQGR